MNVLVTGAAGFIGSHIAVHLLNEGHRVVALDDLSGGFLANVPTKATWVRASVCDHKKLGRLFAREKFDYVFHLAAYAAEALSPFIRRFNYQNNLVGSANVINECVKHKVKCLVFASSIAAYGANTVPMEEYMPLNPTDPYGIAKMAVELDIRLAGETFGLPFIIFRPHNVYGERQNIFDRYRNVIGIFMRQILEGKPMTIFGDGNQERAFSYIDDVAPLMAKSILVTQAYGQAFNIGGDTPHTVNYLADAVMTAMGANAGIIYLPERHETRYAYASQEKLKTFFGEHQPVSLLDGLRRMATWVRTVKPRRLGRFTDIEIMEGLPSGW